MAKSHELTPTSEIVDLLSLMELCRVCGLTADWVIELVDEGLLNPVGHDRVVWQFESTSITVIHKVQRLQADLRLNIPGVAVVLSLVDQNAALKRQLLLQENEPNFAIEMPGPLE